MSEQDTTRLDMVRRADAGMAANGDDLEHPQFPAALRGYDRAAVDGYVDAVGRELRALRGAPETERTAVRRALDRVGEETAAILQHAHDAAEEVRRRGREDAAETLEDARRRATTMIQDAESHLQDLDADTDLVWQERMRIIGDTQVLARQLQEAADGAMQRFPAEQRSGDAAADPGVAAPAVPARELPPPA